MSPEDQLMMRAMVWKTTQTFPDLTGTRDTNLISMLMRCGVAYGYVFDQLEEFRGVNHTTCFGFYRDRQHYAGVWVFRKEYRGQAAIMVQTDGKFAGNWVFILDKESHVMTSRNGDPVTTFEGLEGPALIHAVASSALTEALKPGLLSGLLRRTRS